MEKYVGIYGIDTAGATENARLKLSAPSKMQGWKMQDWKYRHHVTGGGKCGTGIIDTKLQGWKMQDCNMMPIFPVLHFPPL